MRTKKVKEYLYGDIIVGCVFLHEVQSNASPRKALFRCHCGNDFIARVSAMVGGTLKGCGCSIGKHSKGPGHTTHGLRHHQLYNLWCAMKARCFSKSSSSYKDYGGRGVTVCEEWRHDFAAFYYWAINNGWAIGLDLDKDMKGDGKLYSPNTCTFVTRRENCSKRRSSAYITFNGVCKTKAEWARELGINYQTLNTQTQRGWSFERIAERAKINGNSQHTRNRCVFPGEVSG